MFNIDEAIINKLCDDLKGILKAEIKAGNKVVETGSGWPKESSVFIMLEKPFQVKPKREKALVIPECVEYLDVNDPHYWKAEYHCQRHHHVVACRFK